MGLSAPWAYSLDMISLNPVKKLMGFNPMSLSVPWADYLIIIALNPVLKILGINPVGFGAPWDNSFYIIYVQPVKNGQILNQWSLVSLVPNILVVLPSRKLK